MKTVNCLCCDGQRPCRAYKENLACPCTGLTAKETVVLSACTALVAVTLIRSGGFVYTSKLKASSLYPAVEGTM